METAGTEALVVKDLRKGFGPLAVLSDVSFSVGWGEFVCILGPSGCGKTTMLRIAAGLIPFDSGTVLVGGEDIRKNRDYLKNGVGRLPGAAPAGLAHRPAERAPVAGAAQGRA